MANGGSSLVTFINNIVNLITGPAGQALAVLSIALLGLAMAYGQFDMRRGGLSVFGIIVLFSAAWIVGQITGAGGGY